MVGREFISVEDGPVSVLYPGRTNGNNGPDFQDAVIADRLQLTKGDVEVHVKSSDWYSHGHDVDAAYNNVILHVVMWHDHDSATLLQSGERVPVLCLAKALRHQPYLLPSQLPCFRILDRMDTQTLQKVLTIAGKERFNQKALHFQAEILRRTEREAGQVLFRGMMRALGYARNTKPFEDLADRVPLNSVESREGLLVKQALLLGTAGLLPSQRRQGEFAPSREVQELEQIWQQELEQIWQSEGKQVKTMQETDWNLSHIYPNNSPVRRIVAQSYLLQRYYRRRLLAGIVQLVKQTPATEGCDALGNGLIVAGDDYWRDHFDFHPRSKTKISALLGNSKADEIIVNVVLPFVRALGKLFTEPELSEKAMGLYDSYPRLADNEITRHMEKQLCLEEPSNLTACQQQGLIRIFRDYCREGRCSECALAS